MRHDQDSIQHPQLGYLFTRRLSSRLACLAAAIAVFALIGSASAAVRYAKTDGAGSGECLSWGSACTLAQAVAAASSGDSIWVKAGTYAPITLKNGVKTIGGFAGTETAASQSNPAANVTIIDGGGNAQAVIAADCANSTVLRGFTIQNGKDSGDDGGGGMVLQDSSVVVVRCTFKNNVAVKFGGAVAVRGNGSPHFVSCKFQDNGAGSGTSVQPLGGGAVYVYGGTPTFANCLFYDNLAGEGGASLSVFGTPTFLSCTMVENTATMGYGGAVFDMEGAAIIRNSIVWDNTAAKDGDQIFNAPGKLTAVTYSDVEGGFSGSGNINSTPAFLGTGSDPYDIGEESPCKDVGNNSDLPADVGDLDWDVNTIETIPSDLAAVKRIIQLTVDMGAYEGPIGQVE